MGTPSFFARTHRRAAGCGRALESAPQGKISQGSALFIEDQLRGGALRGVRADQNEAHTGQDAEEALSSKHRLQLSTQICGLIVQEFRTTAAGKRKGQVNVAPGKGIELLHLRHSLNCRLNASSRPPSLSCSYRFQ